MSPSSPHLRCAHCGRDLHKRSISSAPGRRVHIVSKGTFHENNRQTFDDIYFVCEGACDRALRTGRTQKHSQDMAFDFLCSEDKQPFEEWETLTDIVKYETDWLARWADRVRYGGVSGRCLATLRDAARLVKAMAVEGVSIKKIAS